MTANKFTWKFVGMAVAGWVYLLLPLVSHASVTHIYTCSDLSTSGSATCSGGMMNGVFTSSNDQFIYDALPILNLTSGTWYVTLTTTLTSGSVSSSAGGNTSVNITGSVTDLTVTVAVGGGGIAIRNQTGGGMYTAGTVTYLCVSDTAGQCSAPPPGSLDHLPYDFPLAHMLGLIEMSGILIALFIPIRIYLRFLKGNK